MIRASDIPPEVVEAAQGTFWETPGKADERITHAIAAAINAWPEMSCRPTFGPSRIILPLPQKESSE